MKGLWVYLHFPQLQLDSLLSQQSSTEEATIIIVEQSQMQVIQLSKTAEREGIREGMSLGAATTLCRALQVQPYQVKVEMDKLVSIADSLYRLTSDICFFTDTGLLLRIHTMLKLYGGLKPYWLAIKHLLDNLGVTYHYGIASTPLAAKLLALSHWDKVIEDPTEIQRYLMQCSLEKSELESKAVQKLNRVGIRRLGELMEIPLVDIAKRFTQPLAEYLGRLSGELPHPVTFYHPATQFERYMELLYEVSNSQVIIYPLRHLLKAMEQYLKLRDQLTIRIDIRLHQREHDALDFSVGAQQGEYRVVVWQRLLELQLEGIILQSPVFAITLKATETHMRSSEKLDLFNGQQGELTRLQLMAILQAKLGEEAVFSSTLTNDHRPEYASQYTNCFDVKSNIESIHSMRPLFLLSEPTCLTQKVSIESGPERLQTGWWDDNNVERDYFIARTQQGQWYWVFRTPEQQWFLHGVFS
jgi:protein ImuB